jgi:copper oxidase (laccase) domain-containing protein
VIGAEADAAVTAEAGPVLVVHTADCAPLALWSEAGVLGVAHVGWRGLRAGVLDRTVDAMAALGGHPTGALVGPCIEAACYAFGPTDLATVVERIGPAAEGRTTAGGPALDLLGGLRARLAAHGVALDEALWRCTACDRRCFSHRARRDSGRSALVAALLGPGDGATADSTRPTIAPPPEAGR